MKHGRKIVSIKQIHRRALKYISEALEQKLYNSKDISEAHRVFYQFPNHMCISQIHNYSSRMTLISPSPYLKTIIKYQTSHSIQHTHKKLLLLIMNA